MPTHQILMISISIKIKSRFIQQYHKIPTMQGFMNYQHYPNFILPKNSTIQKFPKTKKTTFWSFAGKAQIKTKIEKPLGYPKFRSR